MVSDWNTQVIEEFRANGGKVESFGNAPLLILHTTGAKSGELRASPVMYLADGERVLVFASKGGAPTNPDWYHNLVANPVASVEVDGEHYDVKATMMTGAERDRLYARQAELYPGFGEYEKKTTRTIPVVALERVA